MKTNKSVMLLMAFIVMGLIFGWAVMTIANMQTSNTLIEVPVKEQLDQTLNQYPK